MRLQLIQPADLTSAQKPLYNDMKKGIENNFKGFTAISEEGELVGPWNPWLAFPHIGAPMWEMVKALSDPVTSSLPKSVREIVILATGAAFRSGYELYAHVLMAEMRGLSAKAIASVVAGERPESLSEDECCAYEVVSSMLRGGVLPELLYDNAVVRFGEDGVAELIYLIGLYCMISITLNGFDVPIPPKTAEKPQKIVHAA